MSAPLRPVRLGALDPVLERRGDGVIHIRAKQVLAPYHAKLSEPLQHWAKAAPDRVFLAQRDAQDRWRTLSYAEVLARVKRIGAALLRRGLSAERPIAIISGNDIEHALLAPCGDVCRHPLRADLAGLFFAIDRLRKIARHH